MAWWSWLLIGYLGLDLVLVAALAVACAIIELRSRRECRRLVDEAERFLAGVTRSVGSASGA